jgi:hypothetical protein
MRWILLRNNAPPNASSDTSSAQPLELVAVVLGAGSNGLGELSYSKVTACSDSTKNNVCIIALIISLCVGYHRHFFFCFQSLSHLEDMRSPFQLSFSSIA